MSSLVAHNARTDPLAGADEHALLRLEGVGVWDNARWLVRDVSLAITRGARLNIVGANGAGKSTLIRLMAGLLAPSVGRVHAIDRREIGLISHDAMLYDDLTARENIEFFARLHGVAQWRVRTASLMERLGVDSAARTPVRTLSRGMLQRVAIARALVHDPRIILADEPFTGLDTSARRAIDRLLHERHSQGACVVVSSHAVEVSYSAADRVVILRDGVITMDAPAAATPSEHVLRAMGGEA